MSDHFERNYRPNVAIVVVNDEGLILCGERSDRDGAWQLPQGGIDEGETAEQAMYRELEEEIGTKEITLIGRLPGTITYDWPEHLYRDGYHGQEQTYFLVSLNPDAQISLCGPGRTQEFSNTEWLKFDELLSRMKSFKASAYKRGITALAELFPKKIKLK